MMAPKKKTPSAAVKTAKKVKDSAKPKAPVKGSARPVAAKKTAVSKPSPKPVKKAAPKKPAPASKKIVAKVPAKPKTAAVKSAPKKVVKKAPKKVAQPKPAPAKAIKKAPAPVTAKKPVAKPVSAAKAQPADKKEKVVRLEPLELDRPTGTFNGVILCDRVKPFPTKSPYSEVELQKLREALLEERRRLITELASLQGVSREAMELTRDHPGYSVHLAEHATDLQTAEANMGVRTIEQDRLDHVEEALERLEKNINRFGLCLACGNKIGIQRLIARPHAHLCLDCRHKYERIKSRRGY